MSHLLTIPAPCDWLRLNGGHGNRYARADLIKQWRAAAAWEAKRQHLPVIATPVRIIATVHLTTKPSRWDATNWLPSAKACVDGLVDAKRLADDSNRHVLGPDMRAGGAWDDAALVLTFEALSMRDVARSHGIKPVGTDIDVLTGKRMTS